MAAYVSPVWSNGSGTALNATNLQALTDTVEGSQTIPGSITLAQNSWVSDGNNQYHQNATVTGATVTANSKVDLQPSVAQLAQLNTDGVIAMNTVNNSGTVTVYILGGEPSTALTIQCTVTEVAV